MTHPRQDNVGGLRHSEVSALRLFGVGLTALYWELVLIRWLGACLRIVAYYSNFVLIAAFFGLGLGALLASRPIRLWRGLPLAVAATVLGALALSGTWHWNLTSPEEFVWIGRPLGLAESAAPRGVPGALVLLLAYFSVSAVFVGFGQWMGQLFGRFPPLQAYSVEIGGSIAGIVLFGVLSAVGTSPTVWFGVGFGLLIVLLATDRRALVAAVPAAVLSLVLSAGYANSHHWSPYYKILDEPLTRLVEPDGTTVELVRPIGRTIEVNNDFHQMMLDLGPPDGQEIPFLSGWRQVYDLPYAELASLPDGPILVVGAGSGNDVAAALRNTDRDVVAVDIDPTIPALGRAHHPERPYDSPRVHLHNDDARSFFQRTDQRFALVVFGFLDSHTLLSSFSSLRLDNYVYTRESLERVRELLLPGGQVVLTFASQPQWLDQRLEALMSSVFGATEVVHASALADVYRSRRPDGPTGVPTAFAAVRVPTDDWPFLYLERPTVPLHYLAFLAIALLLGSGALLALPRGQRSIRLPYFLLGAAFFLLETSNVTSLSLLFGSTWVVNLVVFSGILVLVLLGNVASLRAGRLPRWAWFVLLLASVLVAWATPVGVLLGLPVALRAVAAVVVFLGPAFFAAVLFASLIEEERDLAPAYGSNVLGTVVGGVLEYLSLVGGFKFLLLITLGLYATAFVLLRIQRRA